MKTLKKIIIKLFKFFVKINFYYGMALILSLLTKPLNGKSKYRVLSLNKSIFSNDLDEIKNLDSNLQFLSFPRLLISEIIKKYVTNFGDLNDASYHPLMDGTPEQEKIYYDVKKVFKHLHRMLNFDAIFAGNYVYVSQQEFFRAAKERGIPVIVLYKEGMFPAPISKKKSKELYRGKTFIGSKLLVYNNIIKKILLDANIPGIHKENISTVGIPRMDNYTKESIKEGNEKSIVLFAFEPQVKASVALENKINLDLFINRCKSFQKDLFLFCKNNPEYSLTIKTKTSADALNDLLQILELESIEDTPINIKITKSLSPIDLMKESEFIAGFLSTTLLEAMLLNKTIITPTFEDQLGDVVIDYFSNYNNVVNYANQFEDFENIFNGKQKVIKANFEQRNEVLSNMIYSLDGESSRRVINTIEEEIQAVTFE